MLLKLSKRALWLLFELVLNLQYNATAYRGNSLRVVFTRVECFSNNTELVPVFTSVLEGRNELKLKLSAHLLFARDINNVTAHWRFEVNRNGRWETYMVTDIDICWALGHLHSNFLVRMIAEFVIQNSNFPLECPFKKGVDYYLRNATINSQGLPPYVPPMEWASLVTYQINGRYKITFALYGKVVRWSPKKRIS